MDFIVKGGMININQKFGADDYYFALNKVTDMVMCIPAHKVRRFNTKKL